jgi:hypothetical protein
MEIGESMGIEQDEDGIVQEVAKINSEILSLIVKKNDLIQRYISDNGLKKVLENIRKSSIENKIEGFYYDSEASMYVIKLEFPDKDFMTRLKKKHQIMIDAFKGISDEFIAKNIRIMGVI